jgi:thiol-disulfide isomerase/thioredoxin
VATPTGNLVSCMKTLRAFPALALVGLALSLTACQPKIQAASAGAAPAAPAAPSTVLGRAPDWKLKDLEGKEVSFAQFKGKVVVVDFWATWCGPCRIEIPGYIELQDKYGKDGLVVIGISLDQGGIGPVKKFVQEQKMNYVVVMGDEETQALFGGMDAIPTTFLIDRAGNIRDRKVGVEEKAEYEKKIVAVLN